MKPTVTSVEQQAFNEAYHKWLAEQPVSEQVERLITSGNSELAEEPEGWHDSIAGNDPEAP